MNYKTGLPLRGLIPVLIDNLQNFRDGWWLKILLLAAVLGVAPFLRTHATVALSITGVAIALYTIALWRSYRYERDNGDLHIRSGLADKLRVHLHTSQISRVDVERDKWCLLLGLVIVYIYTEGNDEPSAEIEYVTMETARKLAGDLIQQDDSECDTSLFYRLGIVDSIKGICLVPAKQLLVPAMIAFALGMPLLDSSVERPDEKLMKDDAVENVSSIFTTRIYPGSISPIVFMAGVLIVGLSTASRLFYALPYFLRTEIWIRDGQIFVRSGIFNLRQWRLRIEDIATMQIRRGIWASMFGGSAVLLQTRGSEIRPGMSGNYIPFLPDNKIAELEDHIGIFSSLGLPERKLDMTNFLIDSLRIIVVASPALFGLTLFLPVSFWSSHYLIYYVAEAVGLFLVLSLWRWRQHWNSGYVQDSFQVKVGQRRWTNNHTCAKATDLHGLETYSLPWCRNKLIAIKPGLPGVDEYITATHGGLKNSQ